MAYIIVLLLLLGILFLVAEILLLPGLSVGAILSIVCYAVASWLAFENYGTTEGWVTIALALLTALLATIISLRAKTWQKLSLKQEIDSTSMITPEKEIAVGAKGVTMSRLSPMGKVEIGGKIYEAKSLDVYIDQKREIEVIGFENFTVIVRMC